MRKEIEVKANIQDADALIETLTGLGCVFSDPIRQEDRVFVHVNDPFPVKLGTNVLRIRKNGSTSLAAGGEKVIFTFKRPLSNFLDKLEHEVTVSDAGEMEEIVKALDYHEVSFVKKIRRRTKYKDYEICVDMVDILGSFVEMEKIADDMDSEKIQDEMFSLLLSFGVKKEDRVMVGYDVLMDLKINAKNQNERNLSI
jgi:adenylate cyclase class 2